MAERRAPSSVEAIERIEIAKEILDEHATLALAMCERTEPWVAKVFFVEDEPEAGRFDICCALLATARKLDMVRDNPRAAFVVGGDVPDRWIQGVGRAEVLTDDAERAAVLERLDRKSRAAKPFLAGAPCTALRIHVERLKVTDLSSDPPITEFTFA